MPSNYIKQVVLALAKNNEDAAKEHFKSYVNDASLFYMRGEAPEVNNDPQELEKRMNNL